MRQKILIIFIILNFIFPFNIHAQEERENMPKNIGLSLDLFGPFFGTYSLGISTFMSPRIQIGIYGTYFDTRNIDPRVLGWQSQIRMNYFFTPLNKSGFYLGMFGGFESVQVQNSSGNYDTYNDPIGGVVPGYRWALTRNLDLLVGLIIGYMFGTVQLQPEVSFIYLF